jgi:hypothetical protein
MVAAYSPSSQNSVALPDNPVLRTKFGIIMATLIFYGIAALPGAIVAEIVNAFDKK